MANPQLFRDLISAVAIGCNMKIEFEDDSEYVEFSTDIGLRFYLMQTEKSSAVTLAIPMDSSSPEEISAMSLGAGMLNFSDVLTEHGKISILPDMSEIIYLSKWRDYYGVERDRVCAWLATCLSEAERCRDALGDLQHLYEAGGPARVLEGANNGSQL
jgi:hypothetical protein